VGTTTEIPQGPALVLEEDPQQLRDGEDHLAMRNVQEELFPHPVSPLLLSLGMAGRAEPPGLAGKRHQAIEIAPLLYPRCV